MNNTAKWLRQFLAANSYWVEGQNGPCRYLFVVNPDVEWLPISDFVTDMREILDAAEKGISND